MRVWRFLDPHRDEETVFLAKLPGLQFSFCLSWGKNLGPKRWFFFDTHQPPCDSRRMTQSRLEILGEDLRLLSSTGSTWLSLEVYGVGVVWKGGEKGGVYDMMFCFRCFLSKDQNFFFLSGD